MTLHCFILRTVFYHNRFWTFFMVAWVYWLRNFWVLELKLFHVWLYFTNVHHFFFIICFIKDLRAHFLHLRLLPKDLAFYLRLYLYYFWFIVLSWNHVCNIFLLLFFILFFLFLLIFAFWVLRRRKTDLLLDLFQLRFDTLNFLKQYFLHLWLSCPFA